MTIIVLITRSVALRLRSVRSPDRWERTDRNNNLYQLRRPLLITRGGPTCGSVLAPRLRWARPVRSDENNDDDLSHGACTEWWWLSVATYGSECARTSADAFHHRSRDCNSNSDSEGTMSEERASTTAPSTRDVSTEMLPFGSCALPRCRRRRRSSGHRAPPSGRLGSRTR